MRVTWLLVPAILVTAFVGILPFVALVNYSVQNPFSENNRWMGLDNFKAIFHDERFINALGRNLLFSGIALLIEVPLGIILALLFYKKGVINAVVSAVIVLPALFPMITIGMMWRLMARRTGLLSLILRYTTGITLDPFRIPAHAFWSIVALDVWHWTSLIFIVVSATLSGMDRTPILSARTEGATRWQIFRYIEFPAMIFSLLFVMLLRLIDTLKIFDEVFVFTAGGPGLTTEFVTQYIRRLGLEQWIFGYASAISLVYTFIILVLSWLLLIIMTKGRGLI